jgi:hypothetical protein
MNSIYDGSYMGHIGIPFNTIERKCAAMTWTTGELITVVFNDVKRGINGTIFKRLAGTTQIMIDILELL